MERPWMKFYPTDWRAEPRLRMCSLAARGLWIDLISYMHEGNPYGYLTINGMAPGIDDIAALVSRPIKEVQKAFEELESRQVFSVDEDGVIYSRRMVRDQDKSVEGRKQAAKRWGGSDPNGGPNRSGERSPITLEARDQKLETRKKETDSRAVANATRPVRDEAFEEFWKAYPKRDGANPKAPAHKAFAAAVKSGADPQAIIAGARLCASRDAAKVGTPYIPQAVKWLRDRRWEDYRSDPPRDLLAPKPPAYLTPPPGMPTYEETMATLQGGSNGKAQ